LELRKAKRAEGGNRPISLAEVKRQLGAANPTGINGS
jgi:hypothetical protein